MSRFAIFVGAVAIVACSSSSSSPPVQCIGPGNYTFTMRYDASASTQFTHCASLDGASAALTFGGADGGTSTLQITSGTTQTFMQCTDSPGGDCGSFQVSCSGGGFDLLITYQSGSADKFINYLSTSPSGPSACGIDVYDVQAFRSN